MKKESFSEHFENVIQKGGIPIKITDEFIYLALNQQQASVTNAVYSRATGLYRIPNNLNALRELYKLGFDVKDYGIQKLKEREALLKQKEVEAIGVDDRLRPYQKQDVNFLMQQPFLANFSSMRTGKTPILCQVTQLRNVKTIVVCPSSMVLTWQEEIHRWTKLKAVAITKLTPIKRKAVYSNEFDVLVLSKETARRDIDALVKLEAEMLIIDEAHFLRNYQSIQSKAMYRLGSTMKYRYALTGTPASNRPDDVFGILKFLQPEKYPSYWQFVERYFKVSDGFFGKQIGSFKSESRKKELHEIIVEISVQRKLKEVMQWIPDTQYQTIQLEMDKKQAKAYEEMFQFFAVDGTDLSAPSVLAQLTRLRQLTVAPSMLEIDAPSVKEEFILEWLDDHPEESVIIFSNFSSYLKELKKKIPQAAMIIGETPQRVRQSNMKYFQEGKTKVILANIQAAGTGLTLDRAGTVIFLDRAYNPTDNEQAEARIVATTEESNQKALVIDLVCKDSVDEKILKAVKQKKNITKIINDYKSIRDFLN